MTIDIHESNFSSDIEKTLRLTTAGASKESLTFSIRENKDMEENETNIVLQKAEALLVAETIRIYFENTTNS